MNIPSPIFLYRIIHINNLEKILYEGKLICPAGIEKDNNYISIGDNTLIKSRRNKTIDISPFGDFSDYISFYFGYRSPMLYNIQNGYNNVTKRKPEEIIYLVTSFDEIKRRNTKYVFTDGHGYHHLSQFFNVENDLNNVDWKVAKSNFWFDNEDDPDRKRRKQAEFLVHKELDLSAIKQIAAFNKKAVDKVTELLQKNNINIKISIKSEWYYD